MRTVAVAKSHAFQLDIVEHGSKKFIRKMSTNGCAMLNNDYIRYIKSIELDYFLYTHNRNQQKTDENWFPSHRAYCGSD
jgi:hypothetical protein